MAWPSAARMGCLIALSLPFIVYGLITLFDGSGGGVLLGLALLLFWGTLGGLALARLRNPKPLIRIDEQGIYSRTWSDEVIAWEDIALIEHGTAHYGSVQCYAIHLRDPGKYPPSGGINRLAGMQRKPDAGDIPISPVGSTRSWDELAAAISRCLPRQG